MFIELLMELFIGVSLELEIYLIKIILPCLARLDVKQTFEYLDCTQSVLIVQKECTQSAERVYSESTQIVLRMYRECIGSVLRVCPTSF